MLPQSWRRKSKIEDTVFWEPNLQSDTQSLLQYSIVRNETLCPVYTQGEKITQKCKQEEAVIIWGPVYKLPITMKMIMWFLSFIHSRGQ